MLPDPLAGLPVPPPSARSAVHVHLHVAAEDDTESSVGLSDTL
jgi:hypothetical protein